MSIKPKQFASSVATESLPAAKDRKKNKRYDSMAVKDDVRVSRNSFEGNSVKSIESKLRDLQDIYEYS